MTTDPPQSWQNDNPPRTPDLPAPRQPPPNGTTVFLAGTLAVIAAKRPGTTPARAAADATMAPEGDAAPQAAPTLDTLCRRVHTARAEVLSLRRAPGNSVPLGCARHTLRVAIEDYVSTLRTLHFPIPTALRQELLLYQRLHY